LTHPGKTPSMKCPENLSSRSPVVPHRLVEGVMITLSDHSHSPHIWTLVAQIL